jgi:hypothetical protein
MTYNDTTLLLKAFISFKRPSCTKLHILCFSFATRLFSVMMICISDLWILGILALALAVFERKPGSGLKIVQPVHFTDVIWV